MAHRDTDRQNHIDCTVCAGRYPVHSGRRAHLLLLPTPPCLSTITILWVRVFVLASMEAAFCFLFFCSFCLCVSL